MRRTSSDRQRASQQNVLRTLQKLLPGTRVERQAQLPDDRTNLATRAHLHRFLVFTSETTAATLAITHERLTQPGLTASVPGQTISTIFWEPLDRCDADLIGRRQPVAED